MTTWTWTSPNAVEHAVEAGGRCLTCGRQHVPVVYQASDNGAGEVTVSPALYGGRDLSLEEPDMRVLQDDAAPADAVLASAGWERAGRWTWGGFTWNARVRPAAGTVFPADPEFVIHLPLTGADGPVVTRWYENGSGQRRAAQVTYPDGSRATVTLDRLALSGADPQVWASAGAGSGYQVTAWFCPGHGGAVCQYGMCDEVRYTGPLTDQEGNSHG